MWEFEEEEQSEQEKAECVQPQTVGEQMSEREGEQRMREKRWKLQALKICLSVCTQKSSLCIFIMRLPDIPASS